MNSTWHRCRLWQMRSQGSWRAPSIGRSRFGRMCRADWYGIKQNRTRICIKEPHQLQFTVGGGFLMGGYWGRGSTRLGREGRIEVWINTVPGKRSIINHRSPHFFTKLPMIFIQTVRRLRYSNTFFYSLANCVVLLFGSIINHLSQFICTVFMKIVVRTMKYN